MTKQNALPMGTAPITKLLFSFAMPSLAALLANALYNIVDRIFIGHAVGPLGLAAVSVVFPLVLVQSSLSTLLSVGTSSLVARRLGEERPHEAALVMGNGLVLTVLTAMTICAALWFFLEPLAQLAGATGRLMGLTGSYLRIALWGLGIQFISVVLSSLTRSLGQPRQAMWAILVGAVVNVALDWLFVMHFQWGIEGAAWATVISQVLSFSLLVWRFLPSRCPLVIERLHLKISPRLVASIMMLGLSPFLMEISFSLSVALFNVILRDQGGEIALSAMGIFFSLDSLFYLPVFGLAQATMPLVAFNYGAGLHHRVRRLVRIATTAAVLYFCGSVAITWLWAERLAMLFNSTDSLLISLAARSMRIGYACLPLGGISIIASSVLQGLGRAKKGLLFSLGKQLSLLLPLMILPRYWGSDGVWASFPVVDGLGGLAGGLLIYLEMKRLAPNDSHSLKGASQ